MCMNLIKNVGAVQVNLCAISFILTKSSEKKNIKTSPS